MILYYDPLDRACKSITGAVARMSELTLTVYRKQGGEAYFSADACSLVFYRDGEEPAVFPMKKTEEGWTITLRLRSVGLYFYYFALDCGKLGCGALRRAVPSYEPATWQITVYDEDYTTPEWLKGGLIYQIFPDRFYKSGDLPAPAGKILRTDWGGQPTFRPNEQGKVENNDFFGGNLRGICEKLDYLVSLGVTAIYLNPIFKAYSNHRYDTGDYMEIDPLLGTADDLDRLVCEADRRGIRIVLDGVFNHTGDDSRYFNKYGNYDSVGAYQSRKSPYADWYRFRSFPDDYESWWGIDVLPAVNEASESYREFICGENGVLRHWLRHGIGGFRLDVADELPDFFLETVRETVKDEAPDAVIIGEVWEDASNKIAYSERRKYLQGFELDSVMNYPLKDAILNFVLTGNTLKLRETVAALIDNYPKTTLDGLMNLLGTHDTPRVLTVMGGKHCADKEEMAITALDEAEQARAAEKVKMAAVLQYTLPGVPCLYYGDEIGMQGYSDPFCRGCFAWEKVGCDLNAFYAKLGAVRGGKLREIFRAGEYREVYADGSCLIFERRAGRKRAYIFVNNSAREYTVRLSGKFREFLTDAVSEGKYTIGKYSYGIFAKE